MEQTIELQIKGIRDEILSKISEGASKADLQKLQKQTDALDMLVQKGGGHFIRPGSASNLKKALEENASVMALLNDKRGTARITLKDDDARPFIEMKTTLTATAQGFSTSGVLSADRLPGITPEARQRLTVRGVLSASPTSAGIVDFVRVKTAMTKASPQVEASDKAENAIGFEAKSEKVQTLATWIPASRQILDDLPELMTFLQNSLGFRVNLEEEAQLLSGSGQGVNLDGLITQGDAFDTSVLSASAGWSRIDIVGRACEQVAASNEIPPTFVVVHPTDWWSMRLAKDGFGRYILGGAQTDVQPNLFGLSVVPTTSITAGTFLVGSGSSDAAEIKDRMELMIEISTEHASFFTQNLIAIRAERRLALVVRRPSSYVHGSFTSSPQTS